MPFRRRRGVPSAVPTFPSRSRMSAHAAGYVTDTPYTFGYHPELDPGRAVLPLLRSGFAPPVARRACDLGFGQGVSLVLHAAASDVHWWGNDLLQEHVRHARRLDEVARGGAVLLEDTFETLLARDDLPVFDFIGLHGVLSWVSGENRAYIAEFLRRHLAPGGVVYTGVNAMPGWATLLPVREWLVQAAARSAGGSTVERIEAALALAAPVFDADPRYLRDLPQLSARIAGLRTADRRYLAHEYFNRDWRPLFFSELADLMATAGLRFACSAQRTEHLDALNLTPAQQAVLETLSDPVLRETTRDFFTDARFRRDYWVRDAATLSEAERTAALRAHRVALVVPRDAVPERASTAAGEITFDHGSLGRVLDVLSDHRPHTIGELDARCPDSAVDDLVFALSALECVASVQADETIARAADRSRAFNAHVMQRALDDDDLEVLACPVTGGGFRTSRVSLLLLLAWLDGLDTPAEAAAAVALRLGWPADRLLDEASRVLRQRVPVLRALGMV